MLSPADLATVLQKISSIPWKEPLHRLCALEAWEAGDPKRLLYDKGPEKTKRGWRFTPPDPDGHRGLYCGVDLATAGSEFAGNRQKWEQGNCINHVSFRITADLKSVLDLGSSQILDELGMDRSHVSVRWRAYLKLYKKWPPTWVLGKAVYESKRFDGILYPSTKNPGSGRCLLIFTERLNGNGSWLAVLKPDGSIRERIPPDVVATT